MYNVYSTHRAVHGKTLVPSKLMLLNSYLDLWRSGEPGAVVVWTTFLKLFELLPVSACLLPPAPSLVDWFVDLFKELIVDTKIIFSSNNSLTSFSNIRSLKNSSQIRESTGGERILAIRMFLYFFLRKNSILNSTFRIFLLVHCKKIKIRSIR